jgi:glycosyltransferase involved in cell wall biosynthesis
LTKTLIVVVAARISDWIKKGEISPGYFNPDNRFEKILVVSLVPDQPDDEAVALLCGSHKASFMSLDLLSAAGLIRSVGFSPLLVKHVIKRSLVPSLARDESYVVRSYGDSFAGVFAAILGKVLRCRSVASVHTTFTHLPVGEAISLKGKLLRWLEHKSRVYTHKNIEALVPVYSPILASIPEKYHAKTSVIANAVAVRADHIKSSYDRSGILKIISVGRLVAGKSLMPLLEALEGLEHWELTIVGDGPCRKEIGAWIRRHGKEDQIRMVSAIHNVDLVSSLKEFDVFAAYTAYAEIPKTVIEAGLVGLPIVLNEPSSFVAHEYRGAPIVWVKGDAMSYREAFRKLGSDSVDLSELGTTTRIHFEAVFSPDFAGKMMADLMLRTQNADLRSWNKD